MENGRMEKIDEPATTPLLLIIDTPVFSFVQYREKLARKTIN